MTTPAAPEGSPAAPPLLARVELRLCAAFWVLAGTTALLRGTFATWLPYAVPVVGVFALWPFVRRLRGAGTVLDWLPFPLVLLTYEMLHAVSPISWGETIDPWLRAADRAILGNDVGRLLEPLVHPALTAFFSACYVSYYLLPLAVGIAWYARGRRRAFRELIVGELGALFVGYVGYLLLPAKGPHVFLPPSEWTVPLDGNLAAAWIQSRYAAHHGLVPRDAFPSLHTANAVTLLVLTRRHDRRAFLVVVVPMAGLIGATMYLRFHWMVDVAVGAALALAWQRAADRFVRRESGPAPAAPSAG